MSDPPWFSPPYDESHGVGLAGYPSAPTPIVAAGTPAVVPYPSGTATGPVPPTLGYVVLLNASPFTIVVISGRVVTQIAAFTADLIQVVVSAVGQGLTVMPVAGSGLIQTGTDSTVYATWYDEQPPGTYPSAIGAGTTPTNQSAILLDQAVVAPVGALSPNIILQPWMQAVAIRFVSNGGGTADGYQAAVVDFTTGLDTFGRAAVGFFQWFFVPVQGTNIQLQISALLNGNIAGTLSGQLRVFGLAGPIVNQRLGAAFTTLSNGAHGLAVSVNIGAVGTVSPLIPRPGPGAMIRVTNASYIQNTAPAAGTTLHIDGLTSLTTYFAWELPAAISGDDIGGGAFYVGDSGQTDPAEGLRASNASSQPLSLRVTYDIVPTPFGSPDA